MNKTVLIGFLSVVGFLLCVIPVVGHFTQDRNGVAASSIEAGTAEFVWTADNLTGTAWTYTHRVPVIVNYAEVGWLDVDMTFDFIPGQRIKLTSVAFQHGQPTHQGAQLQHTLTTSGDASYAIRSGNRVSTTLLNPLAELNVGKTASFSRNIEIKIEGDGLALAGIQVDGKMRDVPLKRFL